MNNQLTIHELRAYQAGQLDGPARHRVERLLLEDPFYADALEGLEALQRTGASLPKQTAQLRRALHERINESATERRLFPLWVTTMAASIVLVMGIALYFIFTTNPTKAPLANKQTTTVHPDAIVVEMGPKNSAINKTVEAVAVLEAHAARQRGLIENSTPRSVSSQTAGMQWKAMRPMPTQCDETVSLPDETHPRSAMRGPVSSQNALALAMRKRSVRTPGHAWQTEDASVSPQTEETKELFAIQFGEPQPSSHQPVNPERAFASNSAGVPDVTLWSDNSPRLMPAQSSQLAKAYAESKTAPGAENIRRSSAMVAGYSAPDKGDIPGAAFSLFALGKLDLAGKKVFGTITDPKGEPLPGVQVMIKGTNQGTTTNASGQFSLDSALVTGRILQVAYIGFKAQELNPLAFIKGPIQLVEDTQALSEVVVTGYGRLKPKKSTFQSSPGTITYEKPSAATNSETVTMYVTELSKTEVQSFREYVKKEAAPYFQGPLEVRIYTEADGSVRKVSVANGISIQVPGQKRVDRSYVPSSEVRAEAERLARQFPAWPKKRQTLLWITGWNN